MNGKGARCSTSSTSGNDLERRVEELTAQLTAANKELESFSYSVSHDLRAPLRGIDGFSQALLEDYSQTLDATGQIHLHRVRSATQRMFLMIDELVSLSRVSHIELRRESVDLSAVALSVIGELKTTSSRPSVQTVISDGLTADGDFALLRIAIAHLIGNAWKFTSKHETARIEVGQYRDGDRPVYFVRDDGAGFDLAHAQRLFGAFQRFHVETEFPGTGIGLATVQRIVHKHGGHIWAEAEIEKGATFYFTL
jgi:light-regulated signal transduction histidine kinase (bacteriophytochrome)